MSILSAIGLSDAKPGKCTEPSDNFQNVKILDLTDDSIVRGVLGLDPASLLPSEGQALNPASSTFMLSHAAKALGFNAILTASALDEGCKNLIRFS